MQPLDTLPRLTSRRVRSYQQFGRHSMRIYALMLGIALTTGYGYAAELAVSSVDPGRQTRANPPAPIPGHLAQANLSGDRVVLRRPLRLAAGAALRDSRAAGRHGPPAHGAARPAQ